MADYIDRAEVMEWVENWHKMNRYYHPYAKGKNIPTAELADIMERIPSADVRENIRGHWIRKKTEVWNKDGGKADINVYADFCSVCGSFGTRELDNFCPNCGADMREVQDAK